MAEVYEERGRPEIALVLYQRAVACGCQEDEVRQHLNLLVGRGVGVPRPD
jgi:hypothetical protein